MASDRVALEVTRSAWEIVRILEPCVAKVIVVSPDDTGITQARAKTDRLDSRTLARLLWLGELARCGFADELTRMLRRRLSRREQLTRARTRTKNEIHAMLMRQLVGRPPFADLFGVKGRAWLRQLELPGRGVRDGRGVHAPRRVSRLRDRRGLVADRPLCAVVLGRQEADERAGFGRDLCGDVSWPRSVTSVGSRPPGSWLVTLAWIRRSANPAARPGGAGGFSKQGSPQARWALVEAAFSAVRQPGPLHAFYQRLRARRGHAIATVATAGKLAVLFWCLLTREEQYAHQQPSLTVKKLRRLELTAGAKRYDTKSAGIWSTNQAMREAERKLAMQAEASPTSSIPTRTPRAQIPATTAPIDQPTAESTSQETI